jgi:hypothetical protein
MADPYLPLDDLITPISRQEFEASIYRVMAATGLKTSSWKPGAVVRTIVLAVSVVLSALSALNAQIVRSGFLELAQGPWLRICAYFLYNTKAKTATFATGTVRIDNTSTRVYNEETGDLRLLGAENQEYVSLEPFVCAAYQTNILIAVRASTAGSIGTAFAGTITRFAAAYPGLTVTNSSDLIGDDDESPASLIARARAGAASVSPNGPIDAYERVALDAEFPDGTTLGINRVRGVTGPGDGSCTVYAATASGVVTGVVTDVTTPLGRLQQLLTTKACPLGMSVNAASGIGLTVNIVYQLWMYTTAGLTAAQAHQKVQSAVSLFLRSAKIGGDRPTESAGAIYHDKLRAVILGAIPDGAGFHCLLTTPPADVSCERYSSIQVGTITGTVNLVQPS